MKAKFTSLFLLLAAPLLHAQATPGLMSYQGRVTDAAGVLIGNTTPVNRAVIFSLYSTASDGSPLYSETQSVTISGGEFSVLIGNGTGISGVPGPSSPATSPYKSLSDIVNSGTYSNLYLGITVDDGTAAADIEISPRQQMVSGAFALRAKVAESVAGSSVTTTMLRDEGVTTTKIAPSAVDSSRILDASIITADVKDLAITAAKLDTATVGVWTPVGSSVYRNNNVGIGEANPGFPLNFASSPGDKISLYGNSGAVYGIGIQSNLLQIHTSGSTADVAFGYGSSAAMTETMRIKGNGNVGIGTNAPAEKLVVSGTAQATRLYSDGVVRARGGSYGTNGTNTGFTFDSNGDTDGGMFSGADGILQFYTNGTEKVRLNGSGYLGIGTTAPAEKVSIQDGKLWFTTATGNGDNGGIGGTMASNDYYRIFGAGDNDSGALFIDTYDGAIEPIIFRQVSGPPGGTMTAFERMRIAANGNLSVGTSTLTGERLNVNGKLLLSYNNTDTDKATLEFDGNGFIVTVTGGGNGSRYMFYDGDSNIDFISDIRMKKDIVPAEDVLERVLDIDFKRFHMLDEEATDPLELGVIAQQVEPLFPELIGQITLPNGELRKSFGYTALGTLACKAVQELHGQMQEKDARISDLEARLSALEKLIQTAK